MVAADVNLLPLDRMKSRFPLAANVSEWNTSGLALSEAAARSFELIIALDVLEHVKDLPGTLAQLLRLLQPGGELIVSGPTENALYRFGRRLAGPEYSGDYHERGVARDPAHAQPAGTHHSARYAVLARAAFRNIRRPALKKAIRAPEAETGRSPCRSDLRASRTNGMN